MAYIMVSAESSPSSLGILPVCRLLRDCLRVVEQAQAACIREHTHVRGWVEGAALCTRRRRRATVVASTSRRAYSSVSDVRRPSEVGRAPTSLFSKSCLWTKRRNSKRACVRVMFRGFTSSFGAAGFVRLRACVHSDERGRLPNLVWDSTYKRVTRQQPDKARVSQGALEAKSVSGRRGTRAPRGRGAAHTCP